MDTTIRKTERTYVRLIIGLLTGLILLVLLIWGGSRFYYSWQERHVLRRAAAFLSGGDVRAAGLSARRAYQLNPESVAAARMLAEIAEAAGERTALDWRRKAVQLAPNSSEDRIAWAKSAIMFEELGTAEKALAAVDESERTAPYYAASAQLAEARGEPAAARENWAKAAELDPADKSYLVRRAAASLNLPDAAAQESARATLEGLRNDPAQRRAATRALIVDGARQRRNSEETLALARDLQGYPEATFGDQLLYLEILRQLRRPDFTSYLTRLQEEAQKRPADLAGLVSWMNKSKLSLLALSYTRNLDPKILTGWPVRVALAESYSVVGDWEGLEAWTKGQSWGALDFLRRAHLARALRNREQTVAAEKEWNAARKEAASETQYLTLLTRTVIEWRWIDEAVELLWTLAKDPMEQKAALRSLYRHYSESGDTAGLYRTLQRLVEVLPEDLSLQNNLAQIGLLLNADPERARKLASELHEKMPNEAAYVSTYAFALFSRGDAAGAVQAMASLKEEQLRDPALACYYGIFLASAGQFEAARKYLELGADARLLPEERTLVEKARTKLQ